jgi:hypothetical protein
MLMSRTDSWLASFAASLLRGGAPNQRVHPGQELTDAERLGQVIVRTHVQPAHDLFLSREGCQHQDGHLGRLPDGSADLSPVQVR